MTLPLEQFPLIEDFEVILWTMVYRQEREEFQFRYSVYFFSPTKGFLTQFMLPELTVWDLCREDFTLLRGDFTMPLFDCDQGWAQLIAEREDEVYVLMGRFEELLDKKGYYTWFKVNKQRYESQWEHAIQLSHQWCAQWKDVQ